ncbi:methylamine methyltransferase corrinoid protein reductive activase [Methanosarcina mazei]|jgi:methylamine methyltransferase corrinoid protein reductive activase|uniref:4Fe-4S ferredoxin n=5 Tax=Methanosarcina mazei TaxID=2209 RepID=A0A0F8HN88_METMZ|nr:methylamine methyltransferase corrinoid protein reductive activase [Methanosarcina mazei]AAM30636.1 putative Flavoprotein [Methanosarcina mazei Go1]AGF96364.1 Methyltransferase corrinoid activation protein [Methanosarcina mazei Tuc01]AKB39377.1 ferredoxin [Methanosarcina mazei WWM610]AKB63561.1 ferredoxin [Methanosarcina mazei S-6]KKF99810.1 4Fe-4S ferredoxin [Methanosarcina mazei]
MRYGVAVDLGTSGYRAQKIDMDTREIKRTVITLRNPLPGANVMDHMDFAIRYGQDLAHGLSVNAVKTLLQTLDVPSEELDRISICGNPIQLSIFQGITIEDLAYAGERKKKKYNIQEQTRNARIIPSSEISGLEEFNCEVVVPPAIKHEVGADALALITKSGMLESDEISIATDYGTNAEMALKVKDIIYTGSAAAGPALEGQQIKHGTLASPFAISDFEFENGALRNYVLNEEMKPDPGDLVDPKTGEILEEGKIKAKGITGTGVIALIEKAIGYGLVELPKVKTPDGFIHLQNNISFSERDLKEAGKAIGAIRAGHITLCAAAGIEMTDIDVAYMAGAAGTYMDAEKAQKIGLIPYSTGKIAQLGNTSLAVARETLLSEERLWELQDIASQIIGTHIMFATVPEFRDAYVLELAYWEEGMPFKMFKKYLKKKGLPSLDDPISNPVVDKRVERDIPVLGEEGLYVLERVGTYMTMVVSDCPECRKCIKVCPNDAISIDEENRVMISTDLCEGAHCQKCIRACPPDKFDWKNLEVFKPPQQE